MTRLTGICLALRQPAPPGEPGHPPSISHEQKTLIQDHVASRGSFSWLGVKEIFEPRENLILEYELVTEDDVTRQVLDDVEVADKRRLCHHLPSVACDGGKSSCEAEILIIVQFL